MKQLQKTMTMTMWDATVRGYATGTRPEGHRYEAPYEKGWPFNVRVSTPADYRLRSVIPFASEFFAPGFMLGRADASIREVLRELQPPHGERRHAPSYLHGNPRRDWEEWFRVSYRDWLENPSATRNTALVRNAVLTVGYEDLGQAFTASMLHTIATDFHPQAVLACALHTYLLHEMSTGNFPFTLGGDKWLRAWHKAWVEWVMNSPHHLVKRWLEDAGPGALTVAMDKVTTADWLSGEHDPFAIEAFDAPIHVDPLRVLRTAVWCIDLIAVHEHHRQTVDTKGRIPDDVINYALTGRGHELAAMVPHDPQATAAVTATLAAAGWGWGKVEDNTGPLECAATEYVRAAVL